MGKKARLRKQKKNEACQAKQTQSGYTLPKISLLLWLTYGAIILSLVYLAFIILKPGMPSGHDIIAHSIRSKIFIEAFSQGQFPVRWIDWIVNNFSGPFFNFYQVGFYYVVLLINQVVPSIYTSIKTVVLLSWWLGALFMFLYSKRFGILPGAFAALIFAFTPYIISDYFVRAAYPESLAIAFSIGILWALDRLLVTSKVIYSLPLVLTFAGLLTTHLPTAVIMGPVLVGYFFLLLSLRQARLKGFLFTLISSVLGIGLAGFYLFPALLELNMVKSSLLTSSYYDFHPHFVYPQQLFSTFWDYGISKAGPDDGMSFQVGIIQWGILLFSLGLLCYKLFKKNGLLVPHIIFWLVAFLYSLFFIHDISISFWENIKSIAFIQYPFRYLMVITFATPILAAIFVSQFKKIWHQNLIVLIFLVTILIFYLGYLHPATYLEDNYFKLNTSGWTKSQAAQQAWLEDGYLPVTADEQPAGQLDKWILEQGQAKVEEKTLYNHYKYFVIQAQNPSVFNLTTHYFPGWKAYIDGVETQIDYSDSYGFMKVSVPLGVHKVEFKFTDTLIRSISNKVTVLSFTVLVIWQLSALKLVKKALRDLTRSESL